ncbi:FMN-binding protein [Oribacterium sp. FC2011]|uniref:FMN-binding protein n=1 Tax=Oribacterium sp. FC2011 TaxID=1408311 RepID=UPI000679A7A6|nr:FMN-binding protein [Oribacterium sp. FC2011]
MKQNNMIALGVIGVGIVAAVVTGMQSKDLGTSSSAPKSKIPADAVKVEGVGQGMDGDVKVELILTKDKIYSINVTEQNETPNIGTMAVDQLPASIFEANSIDVDAVTGATVTSTAIKNATVEAIKAAGFDPTVFGYVEKETVEVNLDEIPADAVTATGEAQGLMGPVTVEITATADKIYNVVAKGDQETPTIGGVALEELPGEMIKNNTLDVDAVSGATVTSDAIKTAAKQALETAGLDASNFTGAAADAKDSPAETKETAEETTSTAVEKKDIPADAVTVTGEAQGLMGPVTVEITATADKIYDVVAKGEKETPSLGGVALEQLPAEMVSKNTIDVDAVSGATVTSDAIKTAAKQALESAGFDKADAQESEAEESKAEESEAETKKDEDSKEAAADEVTATGEAQGINGPVTVEVTAVANKIINLVATGDKETVGIGTKALEELPEKILSANSLNVDAISGATITSDAIKEAAKKALESAGIDPSVFTK